MTGKTTLFDQTLVASLLQPLSLNQSDFKVYKTHIDLKITEQRNDVCLEKELKFEISRADDFEFLYAEILNNGKYQNLAKEHDLTVDFEAFPKTIIHHLLSKNVVNQQDHDIPLSSKNRGGFDSNAAGVPTEVNILLDKEKSFCLFELYSRTPVSRGKIFSIKLSAVRGDQLISHLLNICSNQSKKLTMLHKTTDELDVQRKKISEMQKDTSKLEGMEKQLDACSERIKELEDDLELAKEERESIRALAEDKDFLIQKLQEEKETCTREMEETKEELEIVGSMLKEEQAKSDQLQRKNTMLNKEIGCLRSDRDSIRKNLDKSKMSLKRFEDAQGQQSVDLRKLRELEEDLKEKDAVIISMQETITAKRKEINDQNIKWNELSESHDRLKGENAVLKERLNLYRNTVMTGYSPANSSAAVTPTGRTSSRNNYRNVLGPTTFNSTFGSTPEFEQNFPHREASLFTNTAAPSSFHPLTPSNDRSSARITNSNILSPK